MGNFDYKISISIIFSMVYLKLAFIISLIIFSQLATSERILINAALSSSASDFNPSAINSMNPITNSQTPNLSPFKMPIIDSRRLLAFDAIRYFQIKWNLDDLLRY